MNEGLLKWCVDFVAKVLYVHFYGVRKNVGVVVPHVANNHFFTKWTALVAQKVFKQREFFEVEDMASVEKPVEVKF